MACLSLQFSPHRDEFALGELPHLSFFGWEGECLMVCETSCLKDTNHVKSS